MRSQEERGKVALYDTNNIYREPSVKSEMEEFPMEQIPMEQISDDKQSPAHNPKLGPVRRGATLKCSRDRE